MHKLFNFLEKFNTFELSKSKKFLFFLFSPIMVFLEYICYSYYWNKIILVELATNDDIINYLDKQEFGFNFLKTKIYKKDVIPKDNQFYSIRTNPELKKYMMKEFIDVFYEIIKKSSSFNIENYISLVIDIWDDIRKINGVLLSTKLYQVDLLFVRYWFMIRELKRFVWWIAIVGIIILSSYLFL
jgi:hypothetical protein